MSEVGKSLKKWKKFSRAFVVVTVMMVMGGGYLARSLWLKPVWLEDDPDRAYSRFVTHLPEVDAVSISLLSHYSQTNQQPSGKSLRWGKSRHMVLDERTLKTKEAIDFCHIWRSVPEQKYASAGCHEPIYGLRFYQGGRLILETTFCWECSNISMLSGRGEYYVDFDDYSASAKTLWKLMQEYVPLEASVGTNTTSVPQKL